MSCVGQLTKLPPLYAQSREFLTKKHYCPRNSHYISMHPRKSHFWGEIWRAPELRDVTKGNAASTGKCFAIFHHGSGAGLAGAGPVPVLNSGRNSWAKILSKDWKKARIKPLSKKFEFKQEKCIEEKINWAKIGPVEQRFWAKIGKKQRFGAKIDKTQRLKISIFAEQRIKSQRENRHRARGSRAGLALQRVSLCSPRKLGPTEKPCEFFVEPRRKNFANHTFVFLKHQSFVFYYPDYYLQA